MVAGLRAAMMGRGAPGARSPLGHELAYVIEHAAAYLERGAKIEPAPIHVLRAARAFWLTGDVGQACRCYRAATEQLVELAETVGQRSGTLPEYFRLALGAAWMAAAHSTNEKEKANDQLTLRMTARRAQEHGDRMLITAAQPLDKMAIELLRLRGLWLAGDPDADLLLSTIDRRLATMDANSKGLWMGERDQLTLAAIKALLRERPERVGAALLQLDDYLGGLSTRPPSINDLVDEELMALQAAALKRGVRLVPLVRAPRAGARRAEVA